MWVLERFGLRILGDPSQTIATAMLFRTITQPAWPYRPNIPHPGEISGLGRKNGSAFWNELSISPVIDEQGDVTHHSGVQKDITQQVDYEAELNTLLERVDR